MKKLLVLMALLFVFALPVFSQDSTAVPDVNADAPNPEIIPAATQEATPPVNEGQPSADPAITLKWWQVIAGLFAAMAAGGVVGIAGVGTLANRVRSDAATMAAIEGLAKSVPADVVKVILSTAKSAEAIAGVVEEAFDGVPAASKVTIETKPAGAG